MSTAVAGRSALTERATELRSSRVPFVHARVVLAERPTSAKPGDEALVLADGSIEGFVGGSCAAATVREQSLAALDSGEARLVRITPDPEGEQSGKQVVHNPCLSGGTLEIFLQPDVPAALVTVVGTSPIATALEALGPHVGVEVVRSDGPAVPGSAALVVAAHGHGDEEQVLTDALAAGVAYVGLVASPKRGAAVVGALDVPDEVRARVSTPAGLDIGARTGPEVALSILAEIIARRPRAAASPAPTTSARALPMLDASGASDTSSPDSAGASAVTDDHGLDPAQLGGTAIDPVCSMTVVREPSSLHLEHHGELVWFCGSGCKRAFAADPAAYGA